MRLVLSRRRALTVAAAASALAFSPVQAQQRPEVAKYTRGFSGPQGLKVFITRVGAAAKNEALVGFSGVDSKWDGKVFLMSITVGRNNREQYSMDVNGAAYTAVIVEGDGGQVFLPDRPAAQNVAYSDKVSQQIPPEHLLTEYLKQKGQR